MDALVIATYPRELSVLSGESLPVRSLIENQGAGPASVPSRDGPSPFAYEVRELREGKVLYSGSAALVAVRRSPDLYTFLATTKGLNRNWSAILSQGPVGKVRWLWAAEGVLTVVWEAPDAGSLMWLGLSREGKPSGSPERLAQAAGVAWGMNADGPLSIWMIRQTDSGGQVGLLPSRNVYRLAALAGARLWSVCEDGGSVRIVAAGASKLWVAAGDGADWRQLAEAKDAQRLGTFSMKGCWAEWLEPGYGVRRVRLP